MKTLIAGATGLIGKQLLINLLMDNHVTKVIALVRTHTGQRHPKLEELVVDFNALNDYQHDLAADTVFCCLGTTIKKAGNEENYRMVDYQYPLHLAELTLQNGASQFNIVTALGANPRSFFFYNRLKGEVEDAISKLTFENINIFRPSLLVGNRKEERKGEKLSIAISKFLNPLMFGPLKKYKSIQAKDVADTMLKISLENRSGIHIFESDKIYKSARS